MSTLFLAACAIVPLQAKEKELVGVPGWTNGSQTYLRSRPSADMPAVAKVPRHTRLYVWGKFNGWYRVETSDGKFGWVHYPYVNAPSIGKVAELSHSKARAASNRTASQKLYGDADTMRRYRETYAHLQTRKSPRVASSTQSPSKSVAPKSASKKSPTKTSSSVRLTSTRKTSAPVAKVAVAKVAVAKVAAKAPVDAAKAQEAAKKAEAARLNAQKYAYKQRVIAEQKRVARAEAAAKSEANAKAYARKVRLARLEREKQARAARYQKRLAQIEASKKARAARYRARLAAQQKREKDRQKLAALQQSKPSTRSYASVSTSSDDALRPISPRELQRAREQYLKTNRAGASESEASMTSDEAASNKSGEHLPASYEHSSYEVRGKITVTPPSQVTTNGVVPQDLTLSLGKTAAKVVTTQTVTTTVVTRVSAKKQAKKSASKVASRGGSPRDYARYRAQGSSLGQGIAKQALTYRGRPYIMGAASPGRGFDCSGLIYFLLRQRGYNPPRTAAGLSRYGTSVSRKDLQAGDILLFANTYKRGISHAGIYMGNGKFVHAANSKRGVSTNSLSERYYASKYWGARRVK